MSRESKLGKSEDPEIGINKFGRPTSKIGSYGLRYDW
jgi:hypothetical protein